MGKRPFQLGLVHQMGYSVSIIAVGGGRAAAVAGLGVLVGGNDMAVGDASATDVASPPPQADMNAVPIINRSQYFFMLPLESVICHLLNTVDMNLGLTFELWFVVTALAVGNL